MIQANDLMDRVRVVSSVVNPAQGVLKPVDFRAGEIFVIHVYFGVNYSMQAGGGVLYFGRVFRTGRFFRPAAEGLRWFSVKSRA